MIKKLRIKFVAVNMSIVTIMLCVILGLVYCFTRVSLENQSVRMMQEIAARPFALAVPDQPGDQVRLPYFSFRLGPRGERMAAGGSYYDLSDEQFLDDLVEAAMASPHRLGVLPRYNLRYCLVEGPRSRYLVFADISSEMATLNSLMRNCLLIGALGFFGFLGVSILLSGWAVRPVDRAMKQQRQFIADASHELKTPLTVIMANAQLLENPQHSPEQRQRYTRDILTMSRRMKELVGQMLELARADSAQTKPVRSPVDLSRLTEDGVLPFEPLFFEQGLTLITHTDPGITVNGDAARLLQVLEILLDNARKYARPGGTTWVMLKKYRRRHCLLAVADEGDPIPPEDLEAMFTRFYRADPARGSSGSFGLGLAIARAIVQQHRGRLWAESKNGVNTYYMELACK